MSKRWFPWCCFQAQPSEQLQTAPGGSTMLSSKPPVGNLYPTAKGRTGFPFQPHVLLGHEASQQGLSAGTHLSRHSSSRFRQIRSDKNAGLVAKWPFVESCSLEKWPRISDQKNGRMQCLHLASRSSFPADHIWGGRGKNNCKQTKREWGGWAQIRLISLRLLCVFIFNLGLATSKFT